MRKIITNLLAVSLVVVPQTAQTVFAQETTDSDLQLLKHCETLARGEQSENKSSGNLIDELGLCFTYIKEISALRKEFSEIGSFNFNEEGLEVENQTGSEEQTDEPKFLNAEEVQNLIRQNIDSLHDELILEQSLQDSSLDELNLDEEVESSVAAQDASQLDLEAAYVGQIRQDNMDKHILIVTGQFITLSEGDRVANQVFEKRFDGFYLGDDKLVNYVPADPEAESEDSIENILEQV